MPNPEDIGRLPAMEQDILKLHMELRKSQTEVAKILGVSQPTVNYRYKRARERLDFMEKVPRVTADEIRQVLRTLGARDTDVDAMVLYVETSSQSEVARRMNTSQGAVRHWILRALVTHLKNDMREDDVHKRVRMACSMLVGKPGIFNEPAKQPGKTNGMRLVERRLPTAPKVQGRIIVGERMRVLEGLYADLDGVVTEVEDDRMSVRIDLNSQQVMLSWPR
jgi:DNA-directed RNA polymerase specialized sigma24 family protein